MQMLHNPDCYRDREDAGRTVLEATYHNFAPSKGPVLHGPSILPLVFRS